MGVFDKQFVAITTAVAGTQTAAEAQAAADAATIATQAAEIATLKKQTAPPPTPTPTPATAGITRSDHVFVLVEENHSYSAIVGNPQMPYLNSLASKFGLATQYFASSHPSIGNYFMMTTGQGITNNDGYQGTVGVDNITQHLNKLGKTWKVYAEDLPSVGYLGGDTANYSKHHNPFSYFDSVRNDPHQAANIVPFSQLAADLAADKLPNFAFIVPNQLDNAHSGTTAKADAWLKANIEPLIASKYFQSGGDGVLYLTFDEGAANDSAHGGGHIATIVVSPLVSGHKSTTLYGETSLLRTILEHFGDTSFPGAAASAPDMMEFFGTASPVTPSVTPVSTSAFSLRSNLKPNSPTRIIAHLMIWFTKTAGSHISVGYDSFDPAVIQRQLKLMQALGIEGVFIDWYGTSHPEQQLAVTNWFQAAQAAGKFQVGLMADKGLFKGSTNVTQTLIDNLNVLKNWINSPTYLANGIDKLIGGFGTTALGIDWVKVKAAVPGILPVQQNQPNGFIWENDLNSIQGHYAAGNLLMGVAFYQFDDHVPLTNNSVWGGAARYREGRGSKLWNGCWDLLPANIPFVQLVTWNDYEERTALEDMFAVANGVRIAG